MNFRTTMVGLRRLRCRVIAKVRVTADTWIVRLAPVAGGPLLFRPGQFARVTFADLAPRDYSMASRPDDPILEFHIREADDGGRPGSVSGYVAHRLQPGEHCQLEGPFGDAWLRDDHSGPILAVAGGSGLGPIKAIVESALAADPNRVVRLYHGVRDEPDVYLEARLKALQREHPNFRYQVVLSTSRLPGRRRTGSLAAAIAADLDAGADADLVAGSPGGIKAYLAGPPILVETTMAMLVDHGLTAANIHADPFYPMPQPTQASG